MSSGCGDVLSLEDLQIAKKHQLFEAEVITGRQGGVAGGAIIDFATNLVTGQVQKTMPAILRDIGFRPAPFDFNTGGTIGVNDRDLAVLWPAPGGDNDWYYWEGALPKVIPASSTPLTTGGIAEGAWRPVGDITLRGDLAAGTGATLVGYVSTTVAAALDKLYVRADYVTPEEFGALGNGVADDTAALQSALNSGKNVVAKGTANYRITAQLVWPWMASGAQTFYGNGCIITVPNLQVPVFGQKLANASTVPTTVRKNYQDVTLQGPVTTKSTYLGVAGSDGFWLSFGSLVRCKTIGLTTGVSANGNALVQALYADNMRAGALRSQGSLNSVYGVTAGWTAGDTLIIKSDYSYYADIYAEYAGVIPIDTTEPGPQQGSLISFAQDGNNAGGNIVNGAGCRYYGAGAITVNGFENHVGGTIAIGRPADTSFAVVDRYDPAFYIGGSHCSIGNATAVFVYGGLHLHNGSDNCRIGIINLGTVSDKNSFCQAFVASGTCTNCKLDGLIASGVAKADSVYISMSGLYVDFIKLTNFNTPNVVGNNGVRIIGDCVIDRLDIDWNTTTSATLPALRISGNARINNITIMNAWGMSFYVDSNVCPVMGRIKLSPRSGNTTRCAEFRSVDGTFIRYIQSFQVSGTTRPYGNGEVRIAAYSGANWSKVDAAQALTVIYPTPISQPIV